MKTIPTIACSCLIAFSLQACTATPNPGFVKSSEVKAHSAAMLQHPLYQPKRHGSPIPYQASVRIAPSVTEELNVESSVTDSEEMLTAPEAEMSENTPMSQKIVSIIGQVIVACATSGNCW